MSPARYLPAFERASKTGLPTSKSNDTVYARIMNVANGHAHAVVAPTELLDRIHPVVSDSRDRIDSILSALDIDPGEHASLSNFELAKLALTGIRRACAEAGLVYSLVEKDPNLCVIYRRSRSKQAAFASLLVFNPTVAVHVVTQQSAYQLGDKDNEEPALNGQSTVDAMKYLSYGYAADDIECALEMQVLGDLLRQVATPAAMRVDRTTYRACIAASRLHRSRFPAWLTGVRSLHGACLEHVAVSREEARLAGSCMPFPPSGS